MGLGIAQHYVLHVPIARYQYISLCHENMMSYFGWASETRVERLERELKETRRLLTKLEHRVDYNLRRVDGLLDAADAAEDRRLSGPELAKSDELTF